MPEARSPRTPLIFTGIGTISISPQHTVEGIEYGERGVTVSTDRGDFQATKAIITLAIGVLKCGKVKFSPSLPERKPDTLRRLGVGKSNKFFLRFPRVFWNRMRTSSITSRNRGAGARSG